MPGKPKPLKKCPLCGSKNVWKTKKNSATGTIFDPGYVCLDCGKTIGSPPYMKTSRGTEDYRDETKRLTLREEGIYPDYGEICLRQLSIGAELSLAGDSEHPAVILKDYIPEKQWRKLLDKVFREIYLHEWKKPQETPHSPTDKMWEVELVLTHGRRRYFCGWGNHPPYWKELVRLFKPFFN